MRLRLLRRWIGALGIAAAVANGCDSGGQTGSETHWFSTCDRDAACSTGLQCICGVCTKLCSPGTPCGATATATCVGPGSREARALCGGDATPARGVCVATCEAAECPSALRCIGGVCSAAPSDAGVTDTSSPTPPGTDHGEGGATYGRESGTTRVPESGPERVPESGTSPRSSAGIDASADARPGPTLDAAAGAVDAAGWAIECDDLPLAGATQLVPGVNVVVLSAPSGIYFGSPSPAGDGLVLERLGSNGLIDEPLGNRKIAIDVQSIGVGGFLFSSETAGNGWFSPSENRVVVSSASTGLTGPYLVTLYLGDPAFGFEPALYDGGIALTAVEIEPAPDAGFPVTRPVSAARALVTNDYPSWMTGDNTALYFADMDTIYELELTGSATAHRFASPIADVNGLRLAGNELLVARSPDTSDPKAGGIVAIDRTTHAERQLAVGDPANQPLAAGDSVYYTMPYPARGPSCFALRRVPLAGGAPETVAVSGFMTMVASETDLYVGTFRGLFKAPLRP